MDAKASGASKQGVSHEKLLAVLDYQMSNLLTEVEKAALEMAEGLSQTRPSTNANRFRNIQRHLGNEQMIGLGLSIALENFRSRLNRCFGVAPFAQYPKLRELLEKAGVDTELVQQLHLDPQ